MARKEELLEELKVIEEEIERMTGKKEER